MKLHWPPHPLGLGTPLNLAAASPRTRALFRRCWWLAPALGVATPLLVLGIDQVLFAGVSLQRVRDLGSQPLGFRLLAVVFSGITEELVYRLLIATLVAWLAHMPLSRVTVHSRTIAQWLGILVAAVLFGLAHVANLPDVPHAVLRAITINGVAAVVLGCLYWWRGLELAILTHMIAIAVLYIALPVVL